MWYASRISFANSASILLENFLTSLNCFLNSRLIFFIIILPIIFNTGSYIYALSLKKVSVINPFPLVKYGFICLNEIYLTSREIVWVWLTDYPATVSASWRKAVLSCQRDGA